MPIFKIQVKNKPLKQSGKEQLPRKENIEKSARKRNQGGHSNRKALKWQMLKSTAEEDKAEGPLEWGV